MGRSPEIVSAGWGLGVWGASRAREMDSDLTSQMFEIRSRVVYTHIIH